MRQAVTYAYAIRVESQPEDRQVQFVSEKERQSRTPADIIVRVVMA